MLDLTSLHKSLVQLKKSLHYSRSELAEQDAELFFQFRAAAIQAFEYTYELSIKMLRRQLEQMESPAEISRLTYKDFIRTAAEKGLIDEPTAWFAFRDQRNFTAHTYDETKAKHVYDILATFVIKVEYCLAKLQEY